MGAMVRCLVVISIGLVFLAGCGDRRQMAREVRQARAAAYRQWKSRQTGQDEQQPLISGKLSLLDSVKLTLANNKMLRQAMEERESARGANVGAHSAYLPSLSLSAEYQRLDEVSSFEVGTETLHLGDVDNYSVGLTVSQPLFAGGAITARVRAAKLLSLLADQTILAATQDVVYAAETAYYNLLLSQHLVEISMDAVRSSKAHLENVEKRRAGGVASDFDVLRAQVELSNFEADLLRSKNAIIISRANLIKVMGISQNSDFVLSDEFAFVPMTVSTEQAVETAFTHRPDLYSQEIQIRQQREQLRIARSRYLPTVGAYFTNTWAKPDPKSFASPTIEWGDTWVAGVQAAWPLFDGFQREGQIIQEKAKLRQAELGLVDIEETALYELTQALLSMENAEEFVRSQQMNFKRATEGLRLAEVGYEQGINTQVEMIDAQAALTTARVNYYEAIHRHVAAKLAVQRAMGTLVGPGQAGGASTEASAQVEQK
ncbi:MAG TPA: TolC family protein [Sedimentisphaerales bacterium]|jgi:outer membrane protein|nr:TolC family protein [Sedimentisphaerales bacterium]HNU30872.1 TolC family protein [Sedimentisphaerales bacterium]